MPAESGERLELLMRLLTDAFTPAELTSFLRTVRGVEDIERHLPQADKVSAEEYARQVVAALQRRKAIDWNLFLALEQLRPRYAEELKDLRHAFPERARRAGSAKRRLPLDRFGVLGYVDRKLGGRDAFDALDERFARPAAPSKTDRPIRVVLSGDYGVGRSFLACRYADARRASYDWILWIDVGSCRTALREDEGPAAAVDTEAELEAADLLQVKAGMARYAVDWHLAPGGWFEGVEPRDLPGDMRRRPGRPAGASELSEQEQAYEAMMQHLCRQLDMGERVLIVLDDVDELEPIGALLPQEGRLDIIATRAVVLPGDLEVKDMTEERGKAIELLLKGRPKTASSALDLACVEKIAHAVGYRPLGLTLAACTMRANPLRTPSKLWEMLSEHSINITTEADKSGDAGTRLLIQTALERFDGRRLSPVEHAAALALRMLAWLAPGKPIPPYLVLELVRSMPGGNVVSEEMAGEGIGVAERRGLVTADADSMLRVHPVIAQVARHWSTVRNRAGTDTQAVVMGLSAIVARAESRGSGWHTRESALSAHVEHVIVSFARHADRRCSELFDLAVRYIQDLRSTLDLERAKVLGYQLARWTREARDFEHWHVRILNELSDLLARDSRSRPELDEALELLRQGEAILARREADGDQSVEQRKLLAQTLHYLAKVEHMVQVPDAVDHVARAVEVLRGLGPPLRLELAWTLTTRGQVILRSPDYSEDRRFQDATASLEEALTLHTGVGDELSHQAGVLLTLARAFLRWSQVDPNRTAEHLAVADRYSAEAVEAFGRSLGATHPEVATAQTTRAQILRYLGRHAEALQCAEAAAEVMRRFFSQRSAPFAVALQTLAMVRRYKAQEAPDTAVAADDYRLSIAEYEKAADILARVGEEGMASVARFDALATLHEKEPGRKVDVERLHSLIEQVRATYGTTDPIYVNRLKIYAKLTESVSISSP